MDASVGYETSRISLAASAQYGTTGGATCVSGAPNEVWSYTDQVCEILSDYLRLRERMLPYITELMEEAHEKGTPVMRPLFYDFPEDKEVGM